MVLCRAPYARCWSPKNSPALGLPSEAPCVGPASSHLSFMTFHRYIPRTGERGDTRQVERKRRDFCQCGGAVFVLFRRDAFPPPYICVGWQMLPIPNESSVYERMQRASSERERNSIFSEGRRNDAANEHRKPDFIKERFVSASSW